MYLSRMRTSNSSFQEVFGLYYSMCPSEEQHHRFWRMLNPAEIPYLPGNKTYLSRARVLKGDFPPGGAPAWLCPWGQHPGCELLGWAPGASLVAAVRS